MRFAPSHSVRDDSISISDTPPAKAHHLHQPPPPKFWPFVVLFSIRRSYTHTPTEPLTLVPLGTFTDEEQPHPSIHEPSTEPHRSLWLVWLAFGSNRHAALSDHGRRQMKRKKAEDKEEVVYEVKEDEEENKGEEAHEEEEEQGGGGALDVHSIGRTFTGTSTWSSGSLARATSQRQHISRALSILRLAARHHYRRRLGPQIQSFYQSRDW
ncbi:hypothetical protein ONZ45_g8550 [Pleurotus djamor]|nr:hypothetical protein ONZ45_g8550 [Pleurotus djamor]